MTKIKLVEASVVELKPGHKYIIAVDDKYGYTRGRSKLGELLRRDWHTRCCVALFRGNPKDGLKVIEESSGGAVKSA
jgi:hypothetical protein